MVERSSRTDVFAMSTSTTSKTASDDSPPTGAETDEENKPGTIEVTSSGVSLPRGLCTNKPVKVAHNDVTAVYMLRRSVPWHRAAPVLVVELGAKAMIYPRDWFASEADQRAIITALVGDRLKPADADA
jgi:hypothetical protein